MPVIPPAIRPPSEADSFLLQVTTGCSGNTCDFCGAYLNKPFRVKSMTEIEQDMVAQQQAAPDTRRVFLLDGDALAVSHHNLRPILEKINQYFPSLTRIASYVNGYNITQRSDEELSELAAHKLTLVYMGLESGSQVVLDACQKRASVDEMITAVNRLEQAGIKSSVMVLLGLGGRQHSQEHVQATITALNRMQPRYLSFLTVMAVPGTGLMKKIEQGDFLELEPMGYLREAQAILAGLQLNKTLFHCNHASNYLALSGRLPKDKDKLLAALNQALMQQIPIRPEMMRGL